MPKNVTGLHRKIQWRPVTQPIDRSGRTPRNAAIARLKTPVEIRRFARQANKR